MRTQREGEAERLRLKQEQREAIPIEKRQSVALEQIADQLEEIKSQLASINSTIGLLLRKG